MIVQQVPQCKQIRVTYLLTYITTFLKTRIKATEVWLLAISAGHLKYWRYGKTREFRVKLNFAPKNMAENKVSVRTRENLYVGESELRVQQKSFFPIAIELPSQGSPRWCLRWQVIVRFVGGIVDHHCFKF
jgi:hypothetical protein